MRTVFAPLVLLCACEAAPVAHGVYRSGPNAVARGSTTEPVRVWGPDGTFSRIPTATTGGVLLGAAGPLWIVDHDVPAPPKAAPVAAARVEQAGFRMKELLVPAGTPAAVDAAPDAAKAGGVYVRSVVKVRRDKAPPVYVVSATGDDVGAGRFDGPADVRSGNNCKAGVGLLDDKGETLLSATLLAAATRICAVPVIVPPIDLDGDGTLDVLVYGQNGNAGFRSWFRIDGTTLVPGPEEVWEGIP